MSLPAHQVPAEGNPGTHQTNTKLQEKYKLKMQNQTTDYYDLKLLTHL